MIKLDDWVKSTGSLGIGLIFLYFATTGEAFGQPIGPAWLRCVVFSVSLSTTLVAAVVEGWSFAYEGGVRPNLSAKGQLLAGFGNCGALVLLAFVPLVALLNDLGESSSNQRVSAATATYLDALSRPSSEEGQLRDARLGVLAACAGVKHYDKGKDAALIRSQCDRLLATELNVGAAQDALIALGRRPKTDRVPPSSTPSR